MSYVEDHEIEDLKSLQEKIKIIVPSSQDEKS